MDKNKKKSSFYRNYFIVIACACIAILIFGYICSPVYIIGTSMEPSFTEGDIVRTYTDFDAEDIKKGTVVVAEPSQIYARVIKRVAALPGDKVAVNRDNIIINGQRFTDYKQISTYKIGAFVVPDGYYFLLGDNVNASTDSRTFGIVKIDDITHIVCRKMFHF